MSHPYSNLFSLLFIKCQVAPKKSKIFCVTTQAFTPGKIIRITFVIISAKKFPRGKKKKKKKINYFFLILHLYMKMPYLFMAVFSTCWYKVGFLLKHLLTDLFWSFTENSQTKVLSISYDLLYFEELLPFKQQ